MSLAPDPRSEERTGTRYERDVAPAIPHNRGPLRFEEGIGTDTDVPSDFVRGVREPAVPAPGRPNHVNPNIWHKHAAETMQERAHVGSAAWVDAPTFLGEFAHGAFSGNGEVRFEDVKRNGGRYERQAPATVRD